MVLAIDIGNSNIVVGCFDCDQVRLLERLSTNRSATALEYAVLIRAVLELGGLSAKDFDGGIVCSVVPAITSRLRDAVEKITGKQPLVVGPGLKTGLSIRLDNPAQLGSDRVADAVGAITHYPCPLIIIDMGTATTISVVDEHKQFIGGMIMPGLRISTEALTSRTSMLPQIALENPKNVIGRNTVDCMRSGIIFGCASTLEGAISRIEAELGKKCTVVSTGGNARLVVPHCRRSIEMDDTLLLKGLLELYKKNAK